MTKPNTILSLLFFLMPMIVFSQSTKGMYVNDFKNIIGDIDKEDELLEFAQENDFNYLLLYNLNYIQNNLFDITDPTEAAPLVNFIEKAKMEYGILEVGAVGEKFASFDKIFQYNENVNANPNQQFDAFHIEFEFWNTGLINNYYCSTYLENNGYSCDIAGAFNFFIDQMNLTKSVTAGSGLKTEAYVGQITAEQGSLISDVADRLMVHYYRKSPVYNSGNSIYNYKKDRLAYLAPEDGCMPILPVFSSRSHFMGPWLTQNPIDEAFDIYMNGKKGFMEEDADWVEHIDIQGQHWYRYTDLLKYAIPQAAKLQVNPVSERQNPNPIDQFEATMLQHYPSPANEIMHLKSNRNVDIKLFSASGRLIKSLSLSADETHTLDTQQLANGFYFIRLNSEEESKVYQIQILH